MRLRLLVLILGSFIAALHASRAARADAGVSVMPPTGGVNAVRETTPSGRSAARSLLGQMRLAMEEEGSVHVDFRMVNTMYPTGEVTTHLQGDVSWKLNLLHDRTTVNRTDPGHAAPLASIDLRLVHERSATHDRVGGWQCQNMGHVRVLSTLLGMQETVVSARILGPAQVNGSSTWEVRTTGYSPATGSGTVASVVYDISQTDHTLQRVTVSGASRLAGRTQRVTASEVYSHYGETVDVQLPSACAMH